jgi:hypothetical protein
MNADTRFRSVLFFLGALAVFSAGIQPVMGQALTKEELERRRAARPETLNADPRIVLHAQPYTEDMRFNCYQHGVETPDQVVTKGPALNADGEPSQYFVYVLISGFDTLGVAAVQFGIAYDPEPKSGVDILGWQDCADLEFRNEDWPMAGTGNLMTWDWTRNCQKDEPVVVGFFLVEVYDDDELRIIPRPVDNIGSIVHCDSRVMVDVPREKMGKISFGSGDGVNSWMTKSKK